MNPDTLIPSPNKKKEKKSRFFKIVLPFLIIITGSVIAWYLYETAPKALKKSPVKPVEHVRVIPAHRTTEEIILHLMGNVIPSREILLKPRVGGKIIDINQKFMIGGCFNMGDFILQIDPEDYELAVKRKESNVALAANDLTLELGRQDVAKREWELLSQNKFNQGKFNQNNIGDEFDRELALRQPQLEKARATLLAARAELKQSMLDLERTCVKAPFNGIVLEKFVDTGSQVSTQDRLAVLAGTNEFWINVSIPVDRLQWFVIPKTTGDIGSHAKIIYGNNPGLYFERKGKVIKLLGDLETEGRMARILVSVDDPLDLQLDPEKSEAVISPLLLDNYVRVEIYGRSIKGIFNITRTALHNNRVWIVKDDGRLDIRDVEIIWKNARTVFIGDGLNENERIVISDISAPTANMPLKILGTRVE
ncbi:MAG: HlyD family efflux transporter periplasmic adaptor subunit [Deltaproteobacteria bacterium]|nr:HlyD family efflux transporter periplasmic adaptor subunit [Deltaproteobacteria bacterium]